MAKVDPESATKAAEALLNKIAKLADLYDDPGAIRDLSEAFAAIAGPVHSNPKSPWPGSKSEQ